MITLIHPGLPPTSNNAYVNLPHGGRKLSKEGEKYKNETLAYLSQVYRRELMLFKRNTPYLMVMTFFLDDVENRGWESGEAKSRYKKFDATNRPKLLEDVLAKAAGIDDSQNLEVVLRKRQVTTCPLHRASSPHATEHVHIQVWDLDKEKNPLDEPLSPRLLPRV